MSELNNIDRLFQEKFKDFETVPSDKVWENIQSKMNPQEKEIKLLPLWLRLCSFIAVFLIGFAVATTFIAAPFGISPLKKGTDNESALDKKSSTTGSTQKNNVVSSDSFRNTVTQDNPAVTLNNENTDTADAETTNTASSKDKKGTVISQEHHSDKLVNGAARPDSGTKSTQQQKNYTAAETLSGNSNENALAVKSSQTGASHIASEKNKSVASAKNNPFTTEANVTQDAVSKTAGNSLLQNNSLATNEENTDYENFDANFDPYANTSKVAHEGGHKYIQNKEVVTRNNTTVATVTEKKDISSAMVASVSKAKSGNGKLNYNTKENSSIVADTLSSKQKKIAEGTEAKKEAEKKESKDRNEQKSNWIVSTNVAPIYMNMNGSGSALDSKFDENSKSFQTSMSYGAGLKYALDKKWAVKTGVNVLNLQYTTNDISYYYSNDGTGLEHVNENDYGNSVVIQNKGHKNIAYNGNGIVTKQFNGNLEQKTNYIEVPVELTYKVLNRRFGVEVIGGMSSLFLNDNKVSIVSSDSNLTIGEANNLNKVHFSTNVGLGLSYSFLKNLHVNMEPMLKYQINTYNNNSGDFKPYFIGVYSGISYSF